jgi:hypothetical protein
MALGLFRYDALPPLLASVALSPAAAKHYFT